MASNGYIPDSWRSPLPGSNAGLLKRAAFTYKAMHYASVEKFGVSLAIIDGQVGRTYRSYARQLLAKRIYGSNAATPGTSNHGLALAVDLMYEAQRRAIDAIGRPFGWAKAWSDAAWEWWHLKYAEQGYKPKPDPLRKLTKRQRRICQLLLYHRQRALAEARTGKGRRYRRAVRWREHYRKLLIRLIHKTHDHTRPILARVLNALDGTL